MFGWRGVFDGVLFENIFKSPAIFTTVFLYHHLWEREVTLSLSKLEFFV